MAIELKTEEGTLDKLQEWNLQQIADCGGIAIVMTPSNEDETIAFLLDIAEQAEHLYKEHEIIQ